MGIQMADVDLHVLSWFKTEYKKMSKNKTIQFPKIVKTRHNN